jgi:hypothetical protein
VEFNTPWNVKQEIKNGCHEKASRDSEGIARQAIKRLFAEPAYPG